MADLWSPCFGFQMSEFIKCMKSPRAARADKQTSETGNASVSCNALVVQALRS